MLIVWKGKTLKKLISPIGPIQGSNNDKPPKIQLSFYWIHYYHKAIGTKPIVLALSAHITKTEMI